MADLREILSTLRDIDRGAGGAAMSIGSGLAAQPIAGIAGLAQLLRGRGADEAARTVRDTQERFTYTPQTELGQRGLANIGKAVESVTEPIARNTVDPIGERWPLAGAAIVGAASVLDPTKGAGRAARAVPKSILKMGVSKEAREASAARRAAEAAEQDAPVLATPRTAEERAAVPPDKYRQMYATQGEDAVTRAAEMGEHLRRAPEGGYVGLPRHITNKRGISDMRRSLDKQLSDADEAIAYAEVPQRHGNWYDRARAGVDETTEPALRDRTLEQHGVFSAGVAPEHELAFALRHGQSRAIGEPRRGFRGAQQEALDQAVAENRPAELQFKIGEYAKKNDSRVTERSPFGVNDFRAAQSFGYTHPDGSPWHAGVSDTMHPVMDAEQALVVKRARDAGNTSMTGEKAQELPWVLGKGEDLYLQKKFAGDTDLQSKINALREANKTTADHYPKHTFSATYEMVPGERTGHRPDILAAPFEQQREYGRGAWTRQPMDGDPHARDVLYSAMGMRQMPPIEGAGSWKGKQQPLTIARPLVYPEVKSVMGLPPEQMTALQAVERMRGVLSGQAAVAGNLPVTLAGRTGKTRLLAERMGMNEVGNPLSQVPDVAEMQALEAAAGKHGYDITATSRGALLMPREDDAAKVAKALREFRKNGGAADIEAALPGSTVKQAAQEGFYLPALVDERYAGKGVSTARVLRDLAAAPPKVARDLSASREVRDRTQALRRVDQEAAAGGAKVREDLQKTREFFSDQDYEKVVALIRKGMKPAAAMAAAGFSLQGMAAEEPPRMGPPRQ